MSNVKKLWLGIGVLVVLAPLGVVLPALFKAEGAWGEWGLDEIEKVAGFVPKGMKQLAKIWKAPLPDYALPGQGKGLVSESIGYVFSAALGIALTAGVMYFVTKLLKRKNDSK